MATTTTPVAPAAPVLPVLPVALPIAPHASIRTVLPQAILDGYIAQADALGIEVEQLLSARLVSTIDYTASKPLYFNDEQRRELERYLGKNILHTSDALLQIRNAMSVRVERIIISLKTNLLQKLKSRCIGQVWEKFLEERIVQALEQYVGMR